MRLGECEKKYNNIHAERSEAGNFLKKIKNKGPKIHYFSLKSAKRCIRDSPYLGRGGPMAPMPPPGSATDNKLATKYRTWKYEMTDNMELC